MLKSYALYTAFGAGGPAPIFILIGAPHVGLMMIGFALLALASPLVARTGNGHRAVLGCHLLVAVQTLTLLTLATQTGGITSPAFFALCVLPLTSVFMFGLREGGVWAFLTILAMAVMVSLEQFTTVTFANVIPEDYAIVYGTGPVFLTLLVFGFARAYSQERDRALEQLGEANRRIAGELGILEAQFEAGFLHAPIGMAMIRLDGRLSRVNPALCAMLGRTRLELLECTLLELTYTNDQFETEGILERLAQGRTHQVQYEQRLCRGDRVVWARVSMALLEGDEAGGIPLIYAQFEDVTEATQAREELAHQAGHDPLTGLPTRAVFLDELKYRLSMLDGDTELVVFFVDVDQFKFVNDGLGHSVGDRLLVHVAERLVEAAGEGAVVTRIGGDEFAILSGVYVENYYPGDQASWFHSAFEQPFDIDGQSMYVTVSIGYVCCREGNADPEDLMRHADAAMYEAKQAGRATSRRSNQDTQARLRDRYEMSRMLGRAFDRDEFLLHFQPEIDVTSGKLVGLEALIRWDHPTDGLLSAAAFIQHAEDTGLIVRLGSWVLREGFRQASIWHQAGWADIVIRLNVAATQLRQPGFVDEVRGLLESSDVPPHMICLEITESALIDVRGDITRRLAKLRDLGFALAVDDFGTGYASLAYLKHLPATELKIDSSFVRTVDTSPADRAIVATILRLGRELDFRVIAEGVERPAQLEAIRELGCERVQGYLMGRPTAACSIEATWFPAN